MTQRAFLPIVLSTLMLPLAAQARPAQCPDISEVLAAAGPMSGQIDMSRLAATVAASAQDTEALAHLAAGLKRHLPQASAAELSDLLVASYCTGLDSSGEALNIPASLKAFEQRVYDADFHTRTTTLAAAPQTNSTWLTE